MTSASTPTTIHELASKTFTRTPNGLLFTEDLKTIYSVFLICLDLTNGKKESSKWFPHFCRSEEPFTFSIEEGITKMKNLELSVDMSTTSVEISYKIPAELADQLLRIFMEAKLLHTPADRTRNMPKEKCLLQPTPKGICVLQKYVRDIGLKNLPPILLSDYNSMELFSFERSSATDSIVHSDHLIYILLKRMMGCFPNVWSPENLPEKIPSLSKLLDYNSDVFSFEHYQYEKKLGFERDQQNKEESVAWVHKISEERLHDEDRVSPLAHKFFTNPDSDSHIQYYTTDSGLRICKSKVFGKPKVLMDYCFTTKAIWQWIMDCTDVMHPKEAVSVAALFLKAGLIIPILLPPSENRKSKFRISRMSYYTLSRRAWEVVQWNTGKGIRNSTANFHGNSLAKCDSSAQSLASEPQKCFISPEPDSDETAVASDHQIKDIEDILQDPGKKYLFRRHLESQFCAENLDAFIEVKKFLKKMRFLKELIESKHAGDLKHTKRIRNSGNNIRAAIDAALLKQANECLELGYHIYSSYIVVNSPYELNIDHNLRESINEVMLRSDSPLYVKSPMVGLEEIEDEISSNPCQPDNSILIDTTISCLDAELKAQDEEHDVRNSKVDALSLPEENDKMTSQVPLQVNASLITKDPTLSRTFKILKDLYPLLDTVNEDLHDLMTKDSLQKFIASSLYQEAANLMEIL